MQQIKDGIPPSHVTRNYRLTLVFSTPDSGICVSVNTKQKLLERDIILNY